MDSIVGVMKKVAEQEIRRVYTTELGLVTAVFPHASNSDKDNYQCSVKLKNQKQPDGKDFELRKVPLATSHLGLVNIPKVGELVLVTFIGGDLNAPVITGRLYNDEDQPPVNKENEFLLQHDLKEGGSLKLDEDGAVIITSKNEKNIVTVKDDEDISIVNEKCKINIKETTIEIATDKCTITINGSTLTIEADADIELKASKGKLSISAKEVEISGTASTKISSKEIEIAGQQAAKISAVQVEVNGTATTQIKGAMIQLG
jgi:uncharacterized protein involved in type VI secretion and phage assembly